MGRTEELREKFRNKPKYDPNLGVFVDLVNSELSQRAAFVLGHGNKWVEDLYSSSKQVPSDQLKLWLANQLSGLFESLTHKPRWVDEPDWCFHDDKPLTFIQQFSVGDEEVYVFRGYVDIVDDEGRFVGKKRFFKFLIQTKGRRIVADGIITA